MKTIKIYGDSILKGVMYNEELKRYKLFGYHYDELKARGIQVENNCRMGATIEEGFEIMKRTLGECDKDTLVVLEFGGNDCNYNWAEVSKNPEGEFLPNTPEDKFRETYLQMIDYARSKGAEVAVCNLVPIDSERFMNWVSKGLDYNNIMEWMGDINRISRWQEYYSHISEKVAAIANCAIVDLRTMFLKQRSMKSMIGLDGIHPSSQGHSLISEIFQNSFLAPAAV